MCKKSMIAQIGLPLAGAVGGDLLGPEIGLTAGEGAGIGGLLGGVGGGVISGASPLGIVENAALGGLGGFGLGEVLGPDLGFGGTAAPAGTPVGTTGGGTAGTSAAGVAGAIGPAGGHADAIGGAAADTGTTGSTALTDPSTSGILDFIKKNPQMLAGIGGVGLAALTGNQALPGTKQLKGLAGDIGALSSEISDVQTGHLPPGAQGLVTQALNDSIATIRSSHAAMGTSGSTMEAQDIAAAQERAAAQTFQIASTLTSQGLDAAGLSAKLYEAIAQLSLGQDQELTTALASLAQQGGVAGGLKSVG